MKNTDGMRVECTECDFSRVVRDGDGDHPSDIVIDHGRETGHKLSVSSIETGGARR